MRRTWPIRALLALSGAAATGIGAAILLGPEGFYAGYGLALEPDPSRMSELRAGGAGLAAMGLLILRGAVAIRHAAASLRIALALYLAYAAGRAVSLAADGWPADGMLEALAIELVLGLAAAAALLRLTRPAQCRPAAAG